MRTLLSILASLFALSTSVLYAQDSSGQTSFRLGVSTVGLAGELAYQANENWRIRGVLSGAPNYRTNESVAGISYDTVSKLRGFSVLADRRLGQSNWRLSVGAFLSNSSAEANASGTIQIGNNIYNTTLNGYVEFEQKIAPIIAIGYDWQINDRWTLSGSAGYIYTGGVDVTLNAPGVLPGDLLKEQLEAEAELDEGYPFIELGLYFTF